jgi:hypothetical protein
MCKQGLGKCCMLYSACFRDIIQIILRHVCVLYVYAYFFLCVYVYFYNRCVLAIFTRAGYYILVRVLEAYYSV